MGRMNFFDISRADFDVNFMTKVFLNRTSQYLMLSGMFSF